MDPEEQRKRTGQRTFAPPGPRQTVLTSGGAALPMGGLAPAPAPSQAPAPAPPPAPIRVPTTLGAFGIPGTARPEQVPVPAPTAPPTTTQRLAPIELATAPTTVRPVPPGITASWHLPLPLRDYQEKALHLFLASHRGAVILPTGVGKTLIGIAAINALRVPAVVIVPSLILVTQWKLELEKAGIAPGIWTGEEHRAGYVTISTYQSLYSDPGLIRQFPLIVFDEGDIASAPNFRALIAESQHHAFALLLTATPPNTPERLRLMETYLPVLIEETTAASVAAGALVPAEVIPKAVNLTGPERKRYDDDTKSLESIAARLRTGNIEQVLYIMQHGIPGNPEAQSLAVRFLRLLNDRRQLLSRAANKLNELLAIAQQHPGQRILLFSESVPAIENACGFLRSKGVPCAVISGKTPAREREEILRDWGRLFFVLGSVRVLERGFNVPEVSIAVILASGSGRTQLTQRLGRVLRPSPGKTSATVYVVLANGTVEEDMLKNLRKLVGG